VAGCLANLDRNSRTVEDRTVSNAKRYSQICSTYKALVALHLLQELVGTPVEDRTESNAERADLATVRGYIATQNPTQLDSSGDPTCMQAISNAFAYPNKREHIRLASATHHNQSVNHG
jgi:hypothetical protein